MKCPWLYSSLISLAVLPATAMAAPVPAPTTDPASPDTSTVIQAGSTDLEAVLGSAYLSDKQVFSGGKCVEATVVPGTGEARAGFTLDTTISESQLSSQLGLSVGGRARSGAVEYSASANFLKSSMSDQLSVSAIWESDYAFPKDQIVAHSSDLNADGKAFLGNFERWNSTCGDEYVTSITRGAKLFFSIRVDFTSQEDKEAFQAKFSVSGPMASAEANMEQAANSFSRRTHVTVSAFQIGGDISQLTNVFDQSDAGKNGFIQCTLGHFEDCAKVIQRAVEYAADTKNGFPSQLAKGATYGPTTLSYTAVPYSAMGVYLQKYPGVTEAIKLARQEVSNDLETQFRYAIRAERLLQEKNLGDVRAAVEAEKQKVGRNLDKILDVSKTCYDSPLDCRKAVQTELNGPAPHCLETVNDAAFLPPTFEAMCTRENELPALQYTIEKIRAQIGSPAGESCKALAPRVLALDSLDLSGSDRPSDTLDLRPLATLTHLQRLILSGAKIDDIGPLGDLVNLKELHLETNHIVSVEPLSDMMDLTYLNLDYNQIQDVAPLSGMLRLQELYLNNNRISDPTSLTFMPAMTVIDLKMNPLDKRKAADFRAQYPHINVQE